MASKLIVCCDGTYNTPEEQDNRRPAPTNVWKFYHALESEACTAGEQKAIYLRGVGRGWGASIGILFKVLNRLTAGYLDPLFGGSSGWGLSRQVRECYTFLVKEYHPGDEIFILGFSRGAFAARSLVGLLKYAGLLRNDSASLIRQVTKAYHRLSRGCRHRHFLDAIRPRTHANLRIRFLGVWDTVGALGAPIWGGSFSLNPLPIKPRYHDVNALDIVDNAFQALAIDEQRAAYVPSLFDPLSGSPGTTPVQAWFRGVHSNVGGGYADCGASDLALRWMIAHVKVAGLKVSEQRLYTGPCTGPLVLHDSLGGFWRAGVWPRWFPIASVPAGDDYHPGWGYLHESVNCTTVSGEPVHMPGTWLLDLAQGQKTPYIAIQAGKFWNNTRIVLRNHGRYAIRVHGQWQVQGTPCGPEGRTGFVPKRGPYRMRAPQARLGELVLLVNTLPESQPPSGKFWEALTYLFWQDPPPLISRLAPWTTLASVGDTRIIAPEGTGVLHCFANSGSRQQRKHSGSLSMEIEWLV